MHLAEWNPFREMEDVFSRFGRGGRNLARVGGDDFAWSPACDITETGKEYLIKAELPGVPKEAVKVDVDNGVLTVSGERRHEQEDKDEKSHRIERFYGSFVRSFSLPEDVQTEKIDAQFKDGVLKVRLPRTDIKKSRATQIKVG